MLLTLRRDGYRVLAIAVQGPAHLRRGAPCEDAFKWDAHDGVHCAVVADGAGSARFGRRGAQEVSATIVAHLLAEASENRTDLWSSLDSALLAAIDTAKARLLDDYPDARISDFHATVVGAIWDAEQASLFHIGDGVAAAVSDGAPGSGAAWEAAHISQPDNGEFATETHFFTQTPARLRVTRIKGAQKAIALMSDGAASLAFATTHQRLHGGFFAPIANLWARSTDDTKLAGQVVGVLSSPAAMIQSDDDKCLFLAMAEDAAGDLQP